MLTVDIPGRGRPELERLVLDYNGTIALDGEVLPGALPRLESFCDRLCAMLRT